MFLENEIKFLAWKSQYENTRVARIRSIARTFSPFSNEKASFADICKKRNYVTNTEMSVKRPERRQDTNESQKGQLYF